MNIVQEQHQAQKDRAKERVSEKEKSCHQLFRLTTGDRDTTYEWYKDRVEERIEGTCMWFLCHEHFQAWLKQESGPLIVTADPGCGKSVLAKFLVDHGLSKSATICYFFFKDNDQNTIRQALCAVLHQVFSQKPYLIKHAMPQYEKDGRGLVNSNESLWKIFRAVIADFQGEPLIIVFDALDECMESECTGLMKNIERQFRTEELGNGKLKYLLTCRPYEQIVSKFHGLLSRFPNVHIPGEDESETIGQEVNLVISHRVNQLSEKKGLSLRIRTYLEKRLQEIPHRTYLWVYLVFDYLENETFKKTEKGVEGIIATLPKSVNEAYEQILVKSKEDPVLQRILSIISVAGRPLTIAEMNVALNVDDTIRTFQDLDLEDEKDFKIRLRSLCGLFISTHLGKIYFIHQTAREFLLADLTPTTTLSGLHWHHSITAHDAHAILAEICVIYLNLFDAKNANSRIESPVKGHTFLDYSAKFWGDHFREAHITDDSAIISLVLRICDSSSRSYSEWFEVYWQTTNMRATKNVTDLLAASHFGHCVIAKLLIENGVNIEKKDTRYGRTPLSWAAQRSADIAELLLNKGANIEARDNDGRTPLSWASQGDAGILELLFEKGANIEAKDNNGRTPLSWTAQVGNIENAELLIARGANIEARDNTGRTPLSFAAQRSTSMIELLLEKGADIEAKDKTNQTPLSWATQFGDAATVRLLLNKGAEFEAKDNKGRTPVYWAATRDITSLELLLEKGANIEVRDSAGRTPLSRAALMGNVAHAELLLSKGADIETRDNRGQTPLLCAASFEVIAMIELLVGKGADVEAKDNGGRTSLSWAAVYGIDATIGFLLDVGANMEEKDNSGRTPLSWAAGLGTIDRIRLLVETGFDVESKDYTGRTPLSWAARRDAAIRALLEKGANTNERETDGQTPLAETTGGKMLEDEDSIEMRDENDC